MTWAAALLPGLLTAAVLYVPGALALACCGGRGLRLLVLAPPVSAGLVGVLAIVVSAVGARWGTASFAVGVLVVCLVLAAAHAVGSRLGRCARAPGDAHGGSGAPTTSSRSRTCR